MISASIPPPDALRANPPAPPAIRRSPSWPRDFPSRIAGRLAQLCRCGRNPLLRKADASTVPLRHRAAVGFEPRACRRIAGMQARALPLRRQCGRGDPSFRIGRAARAREARRRTPPSPGGCRSATPGRRCGHLLSRGDANLLLTSERPAQRGIRDTRPAIPSGTAGGADLCALSPHSETAVAGFKMPVPSWMQGWPARGADGLALLPRLKESRRHGSSLSIEPTLCAGTAFRA